MCCIVLQIQLLAVSRTTKDATMRSSPFASRSPTKSFFLTQFKSICYIKCSFKIRMIQFLFKFWPPTKWFQLFRCFTTLWPCQDLTDLQLLIIGWEATVADLVEAPGAHQSRVDHVWPPGSSDLGKLSLFGLNCVFRKHIFKTSERCINFMIFYYRYYVCHKYSNIKK